MSSFDLPKLPQIAISDLRLAKNNSQGVFLRDTPGYPGCCVNCGGMEIVWLQFIKGGPFQSPPPIPKDHSITYSEDHWWLVETKTYPCPVCADRSKFMAYLLDMSGLLPTEYNWTVDYLSGKADKEEVIEFAHSFLTTLPRPTGLHLLYGEYGVGKTGVLKSIVAASAKMGVSARYVRSNDILAEIRSTYGDNLVGAEDEMDLRARYSKYQLLAIDEIDRISGTAWAMSTIFAITDERYNRNTTRATLFATNLHPEQFPDSWGYLASRLMEADRIYVGGEDLRQHEEKVRKDID